MKIIQTKMDFNFSVFIHNFSGYDQSIYLTRYELFCNYYIQNINYQPYFLPICHYEYMHYAYKKG